MIDQQYVQLPTIQIEGDISTLQLSCFLANGIAIGISSRVGNQS